MANRPCMKCLGISNVVFSLRLINKNWLRTSCLAYAACFLQLSQGVWKNTLLVMAFQSKFHLLGLVNVHPKNMCFSIRLATPYWPLSGTKIILEHLVGWNQPVLWHKIQITKLLIWIRFLQMCEDSCDMVYLPIHFTINLAANCR